MWLDLSIIILFAAYSIAIGFAWRKKASRGLVDYFLAGRSLKGWQAGFSMAATQYAADTPLLVAGLIATSGIFSLWRLWIYAIAFLIMGFFFGSCWRRAKILTDAEFTEIRYSGKGAEILRALKAIHLGTLINCTTLAMVLIAATRIAEQFLFWHEWLPLYMITPLEEMLKAWDFKLTTLSLEDAQVWARSADNLISIGAIVFFTWLYSTTGGLRSVVATDVIQFLIAMIATGSYAVIVVNKCGGLQAMGVQLQELYGRESVVKTLSFGPTDFSQETLIFIGVLAVQWFAQVSSDGTGYLAQRMMSCKSDRDAKKAAIIFTFAQVVVRSLMWLPIIIGLLVLYPTSELPGFGENSESFRIARESTFAQGIKDFLPVGIRGLMLTGLLAALASTIDTHLNWGASYWTNDLYKRFLMEKFLKRHPQQKELVWIARLSNLCILIIAVWIMKHLSSIQTAWHLSLLFGSGLGAVLILRWIWYRINLWSELSAGIISIIMAPLLIIVFPDVHEGLKLLALVAVSTTVVIVVTLLTPPESRETLEAFYTRVRPPGFWKPVTQNIEGITDDSLYRFWRYLLATLLCVITVFSLLIGVGTLLTNTIQGIDSWTPYALIGLGLLLIPLWKKAGFKTITLKEKTQVRKDF